MVCGSRHMHSSFKLRRKLVPEHSTKDVEVILDTNLTYDYHRSTSRMLVLDCLCRLLTVISYPK